MNVEEEVRELSEALVLPGASGNWAVESVLPVPALDETPLGICGDSGISEVSTTGRDDGSSAGVGGKDYGDADASSDETEHIPPARPQHIRRSLGQVQSIATTLTRDLAIEIPQDIIENLRFRRFMLTETDAYEKKALMSYFRLDPVAWVDSAVWTYDPRRSYDKVNPFILWPAQRDAFLDVIRSIELGTDRVIEKSRDLGASWICLIAFTWFWLFRPYCSFGVISKHENAVDKFGDPDSLFWKIDHILSMLPLWMLPDGWDPNDGNCRKKLSFLNPENHSAIHGFSTTENAGVGGRKTAIFIDEFSVIDEGEALLSRTSNTSRCRIFNGTHRGIGTAFFKITSENFGMDKSVLHWTDHPLQSQGLYQSNPDGTIVILDKSYEFPPDYRFVRNGTPLGGYRPRIRSPYYDSECIRKGSEEEVAKELDIDAIRSTTQFFSASMIDQLIKKHARKPDLSCSLDYNEITGEPKSLKKDDKGYVKLWCQLLDGKPAPATYAFGVDVSFGVGATCSTISGLNCKTGEKILEWANANMNPEDFAAYAVALARLFCNEVGDPAHMAWEWTGPGSTFGTKVKELKFYQVMDSEKPSIKQAGFDPRGFAKENLFTDYRAALKNSMFINYSELALTECLLYSRADNGKLVNIRKKSNGGESSENHGDRALADALALRMSKILGFGEIAELKKVDVRSREAEPGTVGYRIQEQMKLQAQKARGYWG